MHEKFRLLPAGATGGALGRTRVVVTRGFFFGFVVFGFATELPAPNTIANAEISKMFRDRVMDIVKLFMATQFPSFGPLPVADHITAREPQCERTTRCCGAQRSHQVRVPGEPGARQVNTFKR
jgi:hypothetical protein